VWHGGEPLLVEPSYFDAIHALQQRVFGSRGIAYKNTVQTNLTVPLRRTLPLLTRFFDHVGVSIDVFGDQRVDRQGRPAEPRVVHNLELLREAGLSFGCISVLSRLNAPHVEAIWQFFEESGASACRFLPIYRTGYAGQQDGLALSDPEIVTALARVFECWRTSEADLAAAPIEEHVLTVLRRQHGPVTTAGYERTLHESVFLVNTDGQVYSVADAYDERLSHGNIFREPWHRLRESAQTRRGARAAADRVRTACDGCDHRGACSGWYAAEATPEQRSVDANGRLVCGVARPLHDHIAGRLAELGTLPAERLDRLRRTRLAYA
jgi:uncharacterized protein